MRWLSVGFGWAIVISATVAAMYVWEALGFSERASTLLAVPVLIVTLAMVLRGFKDRGTGDR